MSAALQVPTPVRVGARPAGLVVRRLGTVIAWVAFGDALCLALAVVAALWVRLGVPPDEATIDSLTGWWVVDFGVVVPIWLAALAMVDGYSRRRFARGGDDYRAVLRSALAAAAFTAMSAYLVDYDISRGYYLNVFTFGAVLLLGERALVSRWVGRRRCAGDLRHRAVAVGSAGAVEEFAAELRRQPALGYELVGACLADGAEFDGAGRLSVPVIGRAEDAVAATAAVEADTLVVLSGSYGTSRELRRIGWELQDAPIDLVVMPSLVDVAGPRIHLRPVAGLPLVYVEPPQAARALRWSKALFDRLGAALLLTALSPLLLIVAAAIALEGSGPVLYRHRRIGLGGHEFPLLKFRSMATHAEALQEQLVRASGHDDLLFKLKDDPRVTRVGRVLRKHSLDELPQLINVLRGDMSLVGPRPQVAAEVAAYPTDFHRRLLVRPGMTGLWQVSGRSELSLEESMRLDLYYVDNWSMAADLAILARTVRAVLRPEGAY